MPGMVSCGAGSLLHIVQPPAPDHGHTKSVSFMQSMAARHSQASLSDAKAFHTMIPALQCKFSSAFRRFSTAQELALASAARIARREVLLCTLGNFTNANGSPAISVGGKWQRDFSWLSNSANEKDTIQYDKRDPPTFVNAPGRRIIAVGDVHGDLGRTEWALQLAGVLSSDGLGQWIGGKTVFVQVGDILDRGEDEIAILSLLHNLRQQALLRGGAVFQINGNHETMNVEGDYRYVESGGFDEAAEFTNYCEEEHAGDYDAAFEAWYIASKKKKAMRSRPFIVNWFLNPLRLQKVAARSFLFNPGGPLARKLAKHGVVLKVNSWLFAHGGVLPHHVNYGLQNLNKEVSTWMRGDYTTAGDQQLQFPFMAVRGFDSIVWSRLYSRDDNNTQSKIKMCAILDATLEAVGATGLVVGHTPQTFGANCECKGRIWRIDVGMSRGILHAKPEVLEINGNNVQVLSGRSYDGKERQIISLQ